MSDYRQKLFARCGQRRYFDLYIPELGAGDEGKWRIQSLHEDERASYEKQYKQFDDNGKLLNEPYDKRKALLVTKVSVNDDNSRVFTDEDAERLYHELDTAIVGIIYDAAMHFVGWNTDPEKLLKNSKAAEKSAADATPSS